MRPYQHSPAQQGVALVTALLMLLLLLSLAVGFTLLVTSEQQSNGLDLDHTQTFYAAYGAMEQLNAQLGQLFGSNPQHVLATDIQHLTQTPPVFTGINFFDPSNGPSGGSGFEISPVQTDANGNPLAVPGQINSGPYQGLQGLITDYNITISAQSNNFSLTTGEYGGTGTNRYGSEIRLRRQIQTVAIPVFQFGIFSQTDLSFFPGPNFNFGGRVATNGDLYLANGTSGNYLILSDKVSAYGDIIRNQLSNGLNSTTTPTFAAQYPGAVVITTSPNGAFTGTPPPSPLAPATGATYRTFASTEGSISGGSSGGCNTTTGQPVNSGRTVNSSWTTLSISSYNANLIDGAFGCPRGTGAKNLQLPLLNQTAVSQGATALSLIKEPPATEAPSTSAIFPYRFFAYPVGTGYAMLRILIADTQNEILAEPTVSSGAPMALFCAPGPLSTCTNLSAQSLPAASVTGAPNSPATLPPWAASSGTANAPTIGSSTKSTTKGTGDWYKAHYPRLWGYIKIEYASATSSGASGTDPGAIAWTDVTAEILSLGTTGRNLSNITWLTPSGSANPGNPISGTGNGDGTVGTCREPYPNAILRFQRLTDVPSTGTCGYANPPGANGPSSISTVDSDFIPLMLFDPREGELRDTAPAGVTGASCTPTNCLSLSGTMYYVELDVTNLSRWFRGLIGNWSSRTVPSTSTSPPLAGFLVYFSDRRNNQPCSPTTTCPSSTSQKLGNLGYEDFVNPASSTGQPNGTLDTGEDLNGNNALLPGGTYTAQPLDTYGNYPSFYPWSTTGTYAGSTSPSNLQSGSAYGNNLIAPASGTKLYTTSPTIVTISEARDNPAMFFRRALKLTDAQAFNLGNCGASIPCGLTIAAENPVYVEGNYNATGSLSPVTYTGTDYPSAVIADSVTLLSINWNDINSYLYPYSFYPYLQSCSYATNRCANSAATYYRTAVLAGKGVSFPLPTAGSPGPDFGTDGGVHNFLRYIENWQGTLAYTGSIASFYFNVQGVGTYKCCNTVYSPPTRGYSFNTNFATPTLLPPRTPAFTDINTLGFTQLILPSQQ